MRNPEEARMLDFTKLHNRLYGSVFSFVRLRIKDKEEVKDIVQDVFLKAYNSWKNSEIDLNDEKSTKNFLFIMARQRMIDIWRSARSKYQTELPSNYEEEWGELKGGDGIDFDNLVGIVPLPEEVFEKNENSEMLINLLNKLKIEERELLILRFLQELEYKELSQIYKQSEDNIRQRVSRALQNLRKVGINK